MGLGMASWLISQPDYRNRRGENEGMVEEMEGGFQSSTGLSDQAKDRISISRPHINPARGLQSVLRLSQTFTTTVDMGNDCIHEAA